MMRLAPAAVSLALFRKGLHMKCWSLGIVGSLYAFAAVASVDGDVAVIAAPQLQAAPAGMFAAASAASVRRLTPEQRDEWRFLKEAAAAARFEHDASKMALAKSADANVRTLAAALADQQSGSLPALQRMLRARNMAPPMLANDQRKTLNRLTKLQGRKFDRAWMASVALHSQQASLQSFEKAGVTAHDPQLRAWVERTLPAMRSQVASAERAINGAVKVAKLAPPATMKALPSSLGQPATNMVTRYMGAVPATLNTGDLGEGTMVLGPARSVAVKLSTEPNIR